MKNLFALIVNLSIFSLTVSAQNQLSSNSLYDKNPHISDAARMYLEKSQDGEAIYKFAQNTTDKKLRDGAIYSLGKLKYAKAYQFIAKIAEEESTTCPAAIFAVAEFRTPESRTLIEKLAAKNCPYANTAMLMYCDIQLSNVDFSQYAKLSEKDKIDFLRSCADSETFRKFALQIISTSKLEGEALCFALARLQFDDESGTVRISEITKIAKVDTYHAALALALAKHSDNTIIKLCSAPP